MEASLEQVVQHCGTEIGEFGTCVERYPREWQRVCYRERLALFNCSVEQ
jgi:hypothetical protein